MANLDKKVLAVLVAAAVVASIPNLLLIVLLFTFGFAYPLLYANSLFYYVLLALLGARMGRSRRFPWLKPVAILLLVAIGGLGPYAASRAYGWFHAKSEMAGDLTSAGNAKPIFIAVVGLRSPYSPVAPRRDPCDDSVCRELLLSGQVAKFRVGWREGSFSWSRTYRAEGGDRCPGQSVQPSERCIVSGPDDLSPPDVTVVLSDTAEARRFAEFPPLKPTVRRIEIIEGTTQQVIWRQTQVSVAEFALPFYFWYDESYGFDLGTPTLKRHRRVYGDVSKDFVSPLRQAFGFQLSGL